MITSRINLANLQDNEPALLHQLFKAFNDTDVFSKDDEFEIEFQNPRSHLNETHTISLSHDIIKRRRNRDESEFRYEVIDHDDLIGKGTFGSVYGVLCTLAPTQNSIIAKKNKNRVVKIQPYTEFLKTEIDLSRRAGNLHVKTPTILPSEAGTDATTYMVMKRLSGTDLYAIIKQANRKMVTITPYKRLAYIMTLLARVKTMHEHGIVHRDLKPDNVMLDLNTDTMEIFDYGLSKKIDDKDISDIVGTPGFMPIEAFMGLGTSEKTDVFATAIIIGMILYADQPEETMDDIIQYKFENIFNDDSIDFNDDEKHQIMSVLYKMTIYQRNHRIGVQEAYAVFEKIRDDYVNRKIREMVANRKPMYELKQGLFYNKPAEPVKFAADRTAEAKVLRRIKSCNNLSV
jgi:serine/threonine protein kinase